MFSYFLHTCRLFIHANISGIAVSLKNLLTDPDTTVRQKATECLYVIGCKNIQNTYATFTKYQFKEQILMFHWCSNN